ncbi:MAG: hypothetical protein K0U78_18390 [Actinomycetia bacterium]|nr:hypothetical protein [Actinomycetes bacterium]
MTQTKIASRTLLILMGIVAFPITLADISVAQDKFFVGVGYAPISGEYKNITALNATSSSSPSGSTIDVDAADVSITLGERRVFPRVGFESDFSFHRITTSATNTVTDSEISSITESGVTYGVGANLRSIRTEGIHFQGEYEYLIGKSSNEATIPSNQTVQLDTNNSSRVVLSLGPVFVLAGSSLQHGLLFSSISESEGISEVSTYTQANVISYTFRTLGEGNAYFGQVGFGSLEAQLDSRTSNGVGEGGLLLLTGGVLINDAHEITFGVQNSEFSITDHHYFYWSDAEGRERATINEERNKLAVDLAYRFLF